MIDLAFYDRPVLEVAPDLVGCVVRHGDTAGVIVETEAYHRSEPASHAWAGLTARTEPLFGPPGIAYVYRSYGIHALLNAVCDHVDSGAAVLIRALEPLDGIEVMRARRRVARDEELCNGPGQAHAGARHRPRAQPHLAARRADPHRATRRRAGRRRCSTSASASGSRRPSTSTGASARAATATCRGRGRRARTAA